MPSTLMGLLPPPSSDPPLRPHLPSISENWTEPLVSPSQLYKLTTDSDIFLTHSNDLQHRNNHNRSTQPTLPRPVAAVAECCTAAPSHVCSELVPSTAQSCQVTYDLLTAATSTTYLVLCSAEESYAYNTSPVLLLKLPVRRAQHAGRTRY